MNAASFSNFQGGWVDWRDERHPLAARDGGLPLLLVVDDDRVRREAEQADDLGVLGRAEQDDRVAVLDQPAQLALLLDHPGAGAVDDLEAALLGALHDVGADAVRADDDRRAVVDVVERVDGLDARGPGGRGRRPRCGRPGRGYASSCRRPRPPWPCRSPRERRSRSPVRFAMRTSWTIPTARLSHGAPAAGPLRRQPVDAALADGQERRDPLHDQLRREALGRLAGPCRPGARRRGGTGARRGP